MNDRETVVAVDMQVLQMNTVEELFVFIVELLWVAIIQSIFLFSLLHEIVGGA